MSKFIFGHFYGFPIRKAVGYMLFLPLVWVLLKNIITEKLQYKRLWKCFNVFLSLGMLVVILGATISSRGGVSELILKPFYSLREIPNNPDLGRSVFMNIFLFFPLGLTLPYALPEKWKHNALLAILFAMILSIAIEFLQYYFHLGRAETDDVICNTLGCAIGTLSYKLKQSIEKRKRIVKH